MIRKTADKTGALRGGFSLAELVISIGVLILMMGLAGQVFSITIKSTGQATALTEVTQQIRVLEETLREDLRNVHPGQSVMLIQGNPVNAYWTQSGKDADDNGDPSDGYGHLRDLEREKLDFGGKPVFDVNRNPKLDQPRADLLMFFTARKGTSSLNPAISSRVQQVVYGHADLGEYGLDPGGGIGITSALPAQSSVGIAAAPFLVPAQQWHLARRSLMVVPLPGTTPPLAFAAQQNLFAQGAEDVLWGVDYNKDVLRPRYNGDDPVGPPWFLPKVLVPTNQPMSMTRSQLDTSPPMMVSNRMGAYFLPNCASFKVEWSLDPDSPFVRGRLDGTSEVFWFDHGDMGDRGRLTYKDADPLYSLQKRIDELKSKTDAASKALRRQLDSLLCEQTVHADGSAYSLADRFRGVTCKMVTDPTYQPDPNFEWEQLSSDKRLPNPAAFTALRPHVDSPVEVPDDIWPGALRITVDMFDREGRLDRPIRHVMVIPVGN